MLGAGALGAVRAAGFAVAAWPGTAEAEGLAGATAGRVEVSVLSSVSSKMESPERSVMGVSLDSSGLRFLGGRGGAIP